MASSPYTIYVALFVRDVQEYPTHFKASVRADPTAIAYRAIEGLQPQEVRQMTRELRAERARIAQFTTSPLSGPDTAR